MRYHVNLNTGRTGRCEAEEGRCPVGGAHFFEESEAEVYLDQMLTAEHNPLRSLKKNLGAPERRVSAQSEEVQSSYIQSMNDRPFEQVKRRLVKEGFQLEDSYPDSFYVSTTDGTTYHFTNLFDMARVMSQGRMMNVTSFEVSSDRRSLTNDHVAQKYRSVFSKDSPVVNEEYNDAFGWFGRALSMKADYVEWTTPEDEKYEAIKVVSDAGESDPAVLTFSEVGVEGVSRAVLVKKKDADEGLLVTFEDDSWNSSHLWVHEVEHEKVSLSSDRAIGLFEVDLTQTVRERYMVTQPL